MAGSQPDSPRLRAEALPAGRTVAHAGKSGVILAVNIRALVAAAARFGGVVELVPQVGDFVATGRPLLVVRGGSGPVDDRHLAGQVAFGPERTIEQDSMFAFRVIVDIAIKALSPAINDPTTAVTAIDQLQRLLHDVGRRYLRGEAILDATGQPRLILRTPNWEDFVQLSCSEIRYYGASNFQIARKLQAMLLDLMHELPQYRAPTLQREIDLLNGTLDSSFALPADRDLARIADFPGAWGNASTANEQFVARSELKLPLNIDWNPGKGLKVPGGEAEGIAKRYAKIMCTVHRHHFNATRLWI